jgi:hypothetical protein
MTPAARLVAGITLLTVPTIVYGGLTVLSLVSGGRYGLRAAGMTLSAEQTTYFRAGHAHAGVLVILSLVVQLLLDHAHLPPDWLWATRLAAPTAAILVSGGFFGIAFSARLRVLLYGGALLLVFVTVATGVGLLR